MDGQAFTDGQSLRTLSVSWNGHEGTAGAFTDCMELFERRDRQDSQCYRVLQRVTEGYRVLQSVTEGYGAERVSMVTLLAPFPPVTL